MAFSFKLRGGLFLFVWLVFCFVIWQHGEMCPVFGNLVIISLKESSAITLLNRWALPTYKHDPSSKSVKMFVSYTLCSKSGI